MNMTEKDKDIQELRREVNRLSLEKRRLEQMHALDLSEIVQLRRMCEAIAEREAAYV